MEKAFFISHINDLAHFTGEYDRLYFGNEFCQNLITSIAELNLVLKFTRERNINFTFVTSYVTDGGVAYLEPIFAQLAQLAPDCEIVVNDWGVLHWAQQHFQHFHFTAGRLLLQQFRSPLVLDRKGHIPDEIFSVFQKAVSESSLHDERMRKYHLERIELDNLLQGIVRETNSLKASLYVPYVFLSTTRFCPQSERTHSRFICSMGKCAQGCRQGSFILKHKGMPFDVILRWNTYFIKNEKLPENFAELHIDRLVFQPTFPAEERT